MGARAATPDLRPAIDVDRMAVFAAGRPARLIGGSRNNGAVMSGLWTAPTDRRARLAVLQRLHLGRVGALAILLVERGADRIAENAAYGRAREGAGDPAAGRGAERGADQAARDGADRGAGILLRSAVRVARATRQCQTGAQSRN